MRISCLGSVRAGGGGRGGALPIGADFRAQSGRLVLAQLAQPFIERRPLAPLGLEWLQTGEQHVENHAQRVDVGARVDIVDVRVDLFGAHVAWGTHELSEGGEQGLVRRTRAVVAFASPKSMIRGTATPSTSTIKILAGFRSR